jgi:RNA polymerase sigma factor, sigma-70 family/RNA polymerase sigma-70 factor, sigma-E family
MDNGAVGLVAGSDASDAEADFEAFCRRSYEPMVRLAFLLTSSIETAEDLVQDVLARTQPRWSRIDAPGAYVRRAVVNACNSHHRRRFRERAHADRVRRHDSEPVRLEADELFDVLAELPARMRSALVLRYYQDLPEHDIAELLGCAPGTVRSLIHRGLARLRLVIEP